jgi:dipeptidyl aminopeptidase/acylaminoacyl peptidase
MLQPIDPKWSPDGRWIAFASKAEGSLKTGIYIVHPDGAGLERLATSELPKAFESEGFLSWSPDPRRPALLYTFGSAGLGDIAVFDLSRKRETMVTADSPNEFWPAWSPDGMRVAWFGNDGEHDAIRVAELGPDYQLEQTRSVFVSPSAAPGEGPNCGETPSLAGRYMCRPPAWSPDGQRIYGFDVLGTTLLVVSVDGSTPPERVAIPSGGGGFINWQRVAG